MTHDEKAEAVSVLRAAALYLQHPDVQAIPFAQPASVPLRRVNALINKLEFGMHLEGAAATVKTWPLWKQSILGKVGI